jgi:hypothetical protein
MTELPEDPPRYSVEAFPNDTEWEQLKARGEPVLPP